MQKALHEAAIKEINDEKTKILIMLSANLRKVIPELKIMIDWYENKYKRRTEKEKGCEV